MEMKTNDTLMFECILERDIDLLLMEEWCVNPEFARFFLKKVLSSDIDIVNRAALHSITDDTFWRERCRPDVPARRASFRHSCRG